MSGAVSGLGEVRDECHLAAVVGVVGGEEGEGDVEGVEVVAEAVGGVAAYGAGEFVVAEGGEGGVYALGLGLVAVEEFFPWGVAVGVGEDFGTVEEVGREEADLFRGEFSGEAEHHAGDDGVVGVGEVAEKPCGVGFAGGELAEVFFGGEGPGHVEGASGGDFVGEGEGFGAGLAHLGASWWAGRCGLFCLAQVLEVEGDAACVCADV